MGRVDGNIRGGKPDRCAFGLDRPESVAIGFGASRARWARKAAFALSRPALAAALLATTAGLTFAPAAALAQGARQTTFNVPAGSLSRALAAFGSQSGVQISYDSSLAVGKSSPGLRGSATPQQALARILGQSGLTYAFDDAGGVVIHGAQSPGSRAFLAQAGQSDLGEINVTSEGGRQNAAQAPSMPLLARNGVNRGDPSDAPYATAAPTNYISGQQIERYRGVDAADIFKGTPGVISGDARHSAGAVDVNIRGMQGMGRVQVTVDGAENSTTVYQGYQGVSNRTFVDPDLLGGVDITKGSDAASNGIAGKVAMRTLEPGDIIRDGKQWGLRMKGGLGTNTESPIPGMKAGYAYSNSLAWNGAPYPNGWGSATPAFGTMNRPSLLNPTQSFGSFVAAGKVENFEALVGYAVRDRGNYYAGKNGGDAATPFHQGHQLFCYSNGSCPFFYHDYVSNGGLSNYRAGEQVLNTQLHTESLLGKAKVSFGDGHSLQFIYNRYVSEAGDVLASQLGTENAQPQQQGQGDGTRMQSGTINYAWKPSGTTLIDLKARLWANELKTRFATLSFAWNTKPENFGLRPDYRTGMNMYAKGADLENLSRFNTPIGSLDLNYGVSIRDESVTPAPYFKELYGWVVTPQDGSRLQTSQFGKATWKPWTWLALDGGLRLSQVSSKDRGVPTNTVPGWLYGQTRDFSTASPSVGVTIEPTDWAQFRVAYSNTARAPAMIESISGFGSGYTNVNLKPERASNWEVGATFSRNGLALADDKARLKLGFFDWTIKNYISREWTDIYVPAYGINVNTMKISNIDKAHFSGLELSGHYEVNGFAADIGANYYIDVMFCKQSYSCENKSLYADYATNQVPPRYMINVALSQKLFNDALTVGGRAQWVGSRSIGHGPTTATGLSAFITKINWHPYLLVDLFSEYKFNDYVSASLRVENLTDKYYVDPLSIVQAPGPGRSVYGSMTFKF